MVAYVSLVKFCRLRSPIEELLQYGSPQRPLTGFKTRIIGGLARQWPELELVVHSPEREEERRDLPAAGPRRGSGRENKRRGHFRSPPLSGACVRADTDDLTCTVGFVSLPPSASAGDHHQHAPLVFVQCGRERESLSCFVARGTHCPGHREREGFAGGGGRRRR